MSLFWLVFMTNDESSGFKNDGAADYEGSRFISAAHK